MARPHRIDYPGAIHHVMNRGADHQSTFRDDVDRQLFLTLWKQAVSRFGIVVSAFAILDNHYHVLVQSPDQQLSETLQFIGRSYTQQFNRFYGRDGALFRGRFHSVLVDSDVYLARVARYIELNPVAAGLVSIDAMHRYPWSSFRVYSSDDPSSSWLNTSLVLDRFQSPWHYERFVKSELIDVDIERFYRSELRPGRVLGRQSFVDEVRGRVGSGGVPLRAGVPDVSIEIVEATVLALTGDAVERLCESRRGSVNPSRTVAVALGQRLAGATNSELAERYGFGTPGSVTSAITRCWNSSHPATCELRDRALRVLGRDINGLPRAA